MGKITRTHVSPRIEDLNPELRHHVQHFCQNDRDREVWMDGFLAGRLHYDAVYGRSALEKKDAASKEGGATTKAQAEPWRRLVRQEAPKFWAQPDPATNAELAKALHRMVYKAGLQWFPADREDKPQPSVSTVEKYLSSPEMREIRKKALPGP